MTTPDNDAEYEAAREAARTLVFDCIRAQIEGRDEMRYINAFMEQFGSPGFVIVAEQAMALATNIFTGSMTHAYGGQDIDDEPPAEVLVDHLEELRETLREAVAFTDIVYRDDE